MLNPSRYKNRNSAGNKIAWVLACGFSLCFGLQTNAQSGSAPGHQGRIVQVQNLRTTGRLDARIVSMPRIQQKLQIIQNRSQLVKTRKRVKRVAIADPSIIDIAPYEDNEFAIIGNRLGSTTLTLWFEDDENPLIYEITTIRDPNVEEQRRLDYGKLERKIAILFPNSKVYLIPLHEKLVVKGQARDGAEAARILQIVRDESINNDGDLGGPNGGRGFGSGNNGRIGRTGGSNNGGNGGINDLFSGFIVNMLQVPGEFQVMLHVTIAELNRSQLRQMGVNLNVLLDNGRHVIGSSISGGVPTLSGIFENGDVTALINALATNGTAKILSRPSLTTLSGRSAQFLAGGEFAVPTIVGVGGAQAATTSFRGFGTSMQVTPTVIDGDLIRLQIRPTFSRIDQSNAVGGIPGLNTRTISTTVELREGQSIVLGGLLSRQTSVQIARIPILGDIPGIGPILFSSKTATEDELELLILVTPEIVRAMDPEEVPPMPGYYVTHPNDVELFRYGMTEGAPDQEVYQLAPFGNGVGYPTPVGFNVYNPAPATPQYSPIPHANQPGGFPTPAPSNQFGGQQMNMNQAPPMNNNMQFNSGASFQQQAPQSGFRNQPRPDSGAQSYRRQNPSTANNTQQQQVPNYSRQLFGQNNRPTNNVNRNVNFQNNAARPQQRRNQNAGFSRQR